MRLKSIYQAAIIGSIAAMAGCDRHNYEDATADQNPPVNVGDMVTIQFRRDALGAAAALPISPTTGSVNGAETSVGGRVEDTKPGWILLDQETPNFAGSGQSLHRHSWVPLKVVLLIQRN